MSYAQSSASTLKLLESQRKQAIVINLDHLRQLMREFVDTHATDEDDRVGLDWTFEIFLQWLQTKQTKEAHSGEKT